MVPVQIPVQTRLLSGFDDPTFGPSEWDCLLRQGDTDVVFLTWHWQRAWWETFGSGELRLILAERDGRPVALAPLYTDDSMVFFVGSGNSDYLDFIGDIGEPEVLDALLGASRAGIAGFAGYQFFLVPDRSRTGERLNAAAARMGYKCYRQRTWTAPAIDLAGESEAVQALLKKKSPWRYEKRLRREGDLLLIHASDAHNILPHLGDFFAQHERRWDVKQESSQFRKPSMRDFYRRLTCMAGKTGWLRFTRMDWNGRPIAYHFGSCYRGRYLDYTASFDIEMAVYRPGAVLDRCLLMAAMEEGAHTFDYGLGDEDYKFRFATHVQKLSDWELYPPDEAT